MPEAHQIVMAMDDTYRQQSGFLRSSTYNPLFYFPYNINGQPCDMVFTSVAGHLMELDFTDDMKKWRSCSPVDLYGATVLKKIPQVGVLRCLITSCYIAFSPWVIPF